MFGHQEVEEEAIEGGGRGSGLTHRAKLLIADEL